MNIEINASSVKWYGLSSLATVFFSLINSAAVAQLELKIYQNSDFYTLTYVDYNTNTSLTQRQTNFNRLSVAASLKAKKLTHQLELFVPDINRPLQNISYPMAYQLEPTASRNPTVSTYSFRYELSKFFFQSGKLAFELGAGINPYYVKIDYMSTSVTKYDIHLWNYGAALNAIPHLYYAISAKMRVDLSVPLKLYNAKYVKEKIDNPTIPIAQQESHKWDHAFFENTFTLRLGFCFKF